jgi:hypothetical protein
VERKKRSIWTPVRLVDMPIGREEHLAIALTDLENVAAGGEASL